MKRLMTAHDVADLLQCSIKTAQRYMRQMYHMEKPLRVTEEAFRQWMTDRSQMPVERATKVRRPVQPVNGYKISRVRPA